jgi:hypothetical protein
MYSDKCTEMKCEHSENVEKHERCIVEGCMLNIAAVYHTFIEMHSVRTGDDCGVQGFLSYKVFVL